MTTPESSILRRWMLEDNIPEEYRNIHLNHLPKEKGWSEHHLYQYQGFWYPYFWLENIKTCQQEFQAQDTDVFLVSNPKCGTTWLKSLAFAIQNRMHYPPSTDDNNHPLLTKNCHELVPYMETKPDHYLSSIDSTKNRIVSSHLPYMSLPKAIKDSSASKLIYICRNPKDALVSLWHVTNKLRPPQVGSLSLEEAVEMFCRAVSVAGPFWDHVLQYWQESLKSPDKVLALKYEDLRDEPNSHVKRIAEFMGCPFSKEEEASGIVNEIINFCSLEQF